MKQTLHEAMEKELMREFPYPGTSMTSPLRQGFRLGWKAGAAWATRQAEVEIAAKDAEIAKLIVMLEKATDQRDLVASVLESEESRSAPLVEAAKELKAEMIRADMKKSYLFGGLLVGLENALADYEEK